MKKQNIRFITLGCSKNLVDTEKLMSVFSPEFYTIDHNAEIDKGDYVIINTCGFINDAKEESIDTIIQAIELKKQGIINNIIVWGCLSQRYINDLKIELPEIDLIVGVSEFNTIARFINKNSKNILPLSRTLTTPSHYAYLKISDGCNKKCTFCAIPGIKGKLKSEPIENLVDETTELSKQGVKEIILVAQELNTYGKDLYGTYKLYDLVNAISEIDGIEWIRLHYAYPSAFPIDVLKAFKDNSKLCKYLDIPFQHISDRILKDMKRGVTKSQSYKLIEKIRKVSPEIAIRTSIMVGFPGETKKEFNELKSFIKDIRFERLGLFKYSEEEGTYAAKNYKDNISETQKQYRAEELMEIQREISNENNKQLIGKSLKTIIDRKEESFYIGRSEFDSPEVDNEILIKGKNISIGSFYNVMITKHDDYDLYGKI